MIYGVPEWPLWINSEWFLWVAKKGKKSKVIKAVAQRFSQSAIRVCFGCAFSGPCCYTSMREGFDLRELITISRPQLKSCHISWTGAWRNVLILQKKSSVFLLLKLLTCMRQEEMIQFVGEGWARRTGESKSKDKPRRKWPTWICSSLLCLLCQTLSNFLCPCVDVNIPKVRINCRKRPLHFLSFDMIVT